MVFLFNVFRKLFLYFDQNLVETSRKLLAISNLFTFLVILCDCRHLVNYYRRKQTGLNFRISTTPTSHSTIKSCQKMSPPPPTPTFCVYFKRMKFLLIKHVFYFLNSKLIRHVFLFFFVVVVVCYSTFSSSKFHILY